MREGSAVIGGKRYFAGLDIIRLVAITLVIAIHAVENVWPMQHPGELAGVGVINSIFITIVYILGRLSVPLFLIITGYLMLDRQYSREDLPSFYKRKVWWLIKATLVWGIIYYVLGCCAGRYEFNLIDLARVVLLLPGENSAPHLWYMPMIIGIYIFIPFIARCLTICSKKMLQILLAVATLYLFALPTISVILGTRGIDPINGGVLLPCIGGAYGVYILVGYYIKRYVTIDKINNLKMIAMIGGIAISLSCACIYQYLLAFIWGDKYQTWYDSVFILFAAGLLFVVMMKAFRGIGLGKEKSKLQILSRSIFGIYLAHYLYVYLTKYIVIDEYGIAGIPAFWIILICTFTLSVVTAVFVNMSKCISKLLAFK